MNSPSELTALRQSPALWEEMEGDVILACGLRMLRNLNRFRFASKLEEPSRRQLLKLISSALADHPKLHKPTLVTGKQLSGDDKEFIYERFLFLEGLNQASSEEAFAFDTQGRFLAVINLVEHLQLLLLSPGERIDRLLADLIAIESHLSTLLDFAFSHRFGFLTAEPARCGTGLVANMMLHLPALVQSGHIEPILQELAEGEIEALGLTSEGFAADLVILENKQTIGISEEKIVAALQSLASRLHIAEISHRKISHDSSEIIDRVARAFGLVRHSYKLDTLEAMQAVSLLKLGVLMGWIKGLSIAEANRWLFTIQRAQLRANQQLEGGEMAHRRAVALHSMLASCELLI